MKAERNSMVSHDWQCARIQRQLAAYVDQELNPQESSEVAEHLEVCASCMSEYREMGKASDWLKQLGQFDLPGMPTDSTHERMMAMAISTPPERAIRWFDRIPLRQRLAIGISVLSVGVVLAALAIVIPKRQEAERYSEVIHRELERERVRDSGVDPFAGASIVHFTSYGD